MEVFFLTNAMSFFVGWSWVQLLRDLATLTSHLGRGPADADADADANANADASSSSSSSSSSSWMHGLPFLGEALCVFVFGPVLTYALLKAKGLSLRACDAGGHDVAEYPLVGQ